MACYKPNIRLASLIPDEKTGKTQTLKFYPGTKNLNYEWFDKENEKFKKYGIKKEYQKVPCGWCAGCQEAYAKQWAIRCMHEAQEYKNNWFVTLTYDDEHLPIDFEKVNKETGEIFSDENWNGTLKEKDLQKFIKDLRSYYDYHLDHNHIRFFACGEYGGQTERPHYHMILFNMPVKLEELHVYKINQNGTVLYNSDVIDKIWGKGYAVIAEVNWDTCAYVARYVMKKQKGKVPENYYNEKGQNKEFIRMSRMPGIGAKYAREHLKEMYKNDEVILPGHDNQTMTAKPPKYYDDMYDRVDSERLEEIKAKRKALAQETNKSKNLQTTMSEKERLRVEEESKDLKWNSLKRDKV